MAKGKKSIVKPIIKVESDKHPFEDFEANDEMPEIKSVGYARVSPNSRHYVSYVLTTKGREVVDIQVSEPNAKAISEEEAKISFEQTFSLQDVI